jgi:hypothetical protein
VTPARHPPRPHGCAKPTGFARPWALPLVACDRCRAWRAVAARLALELSCARDGLPFEVLRHGGRSGDAWRAVYRGDLAGAEAAFRRAHLSLRQGGLVLVAGPLTVRASSAPTLRTRW